MPPSHQPTVINISNGHGHSDRPIAYGFRQTASASSTPTEKFSWKDFDKKLNKVNTIALIANILYALNWFLGFCAVTWATTVILGGNVTELMQRDFYSVAVLLLLEALRLAASRCFGFFVTQHLIRHNPDPRFLMYSSKQDFLVGEILRTGGQLMELIILGVSVVVPARRLRDVDYDVDSPGKFNSIKISLQIFYSIVLANAIFAVIGVIYSKTIVYIVGFKLKDYVLRSYYHRIVWIGIEKGLLCSTQRLDVLKFAFEVQAEEYRNYKRAHVVKKMYKDLIMYLYEHPHHKGFEAATVALESDNTFVREAAANIVGLWIDLGIGGGKTLMLQEALLEKLVDALEHQETGRAATSSFQKMAEKFPKETAEVRNSRDHGLVYILIKRIHQVVVQGKTDKALVFLKVLVALMDGEALISADDNVNIPYSVHSRDVLFSTLRSDLLKIASDPRALKRTLVVAAYFLFKLDSQDFQPHEIKEIRDALIDNQTNPVKQHLLEIERLYMCEVVSFVNDKLRSTDDQLLKIDTGTGVLEQWQDIVNVRQIKDSEQQQSQKSSIWAKIYIYTGAAVMVAITVALSLFFIFDKRFHF